MRPEREVNNLLPISAKVMNAWSFTSMSPVRLHGVVLNDIHFKGGIRLPQDGKGMNSRELGYMRMTRK
jgi:hypothetical protein